MEPLRTQTSPGAFLVLFQTAKLDCFQVQLVVERWTVGARQMHAHVAAPRADSPREA